MSKLIFGCGYLGRRVAERWRAQGYEVHAVTRSSQTAEQFAAAGLRPIVADVLDRNSLAALPPADTVLFAVAYGRDRQDHVETLAIEGLTNAIEALATSPARFIYISSTGVYGDFDGAWVDESSPCRPTRVGGRACLMAEELLRGGPLAARTIVLRMAGLYGPQRIPLADLIRQGRPLSVPSEGHLNLIHVDDAASVVVAADERSPVPACYTVSDGQPPVRREYYAELARRLHAPAPRFVEPAPGTPVAARAADDKRVRNERMLRELGITLRYPSYREGLAAIVGENGRI